MNPEKGSSILLVLILLAFLLGLSLQEFFSTKLIEELKSDQIHSTRANSQISNQSIEAVLNFDPSQNLRQKCASTQLGVGRVSLTRFLCFDISSLNSVLLQAPIVDGALLQDRSDFPLFDWSIILNPKSPCNLSDEIPSSQTLLGFKLSSAAVRANKLCDNAPSSLDNLRLEANFASVHVLSIGKVLAASGYIDIQSELSVKDGLEVIAGGDLHIQKLTAESPASITLISTSGIIQIDQIDPQVAVHALGYGGVYLPQTAKTEVNSFWPPLLKQNVWGFKAN